MSATEVLVAAAGSDSPGSPDTGSVKAVSDPHGVSALLGRIVSSRDRVKANGGHANIDEIRRDLDRLGEKLGLVLAEHEGMGDELLKAYEQLGIVFEITRRLASVTEETQVMGVVIESLRAMFNPCRYATGQLGSGGEIQLCFWDAVDPTPAATEWLKEQVGIGAAARRVVVQDCPAEGLQAMVCPVCAGEDFAGALVLIRGVGFRAFTSADMLLMDSLSTFCGDIIRNLRLVHELRQMSIDLVRALVETIDQKDGYTSGHSNRVARYARMLAEALGWTDERLQILEWSALLHDVGKIGIRDEVLKKSGKLTPQEFDHMKEHPVRSSEVICRVPQLAEAMDGVRHHHEHWDGSGYPDGLAGEDIPLQARIIQIADVFDALTTNRSYRAAFTWPKALEILRRESGVVVDAKLVRLFESLILDWWARDPQGFERAFEAGREPESDPPLAFSGQPAPG